MASTRRKMKFALEISENKWRSSDVAFEETTFANFHLRPEVLRGLKKSGYLHPSPIQLQAIPLGRCGLDLIVQSKSGTGKTMVFVLIILEAINTSSKNIQAVILAPTREIASQISDTVRIISSEMENFTCCTFIGGTKVKRDKEVIRNCQVAVGTPGRILHLIEIGILKSQAIRVLVLDEADKLMDDNFTIQINDIYKHLPANKQMLALSATYPNELAEFLSKYMKTPTFVRLNSENPALLGVTQYFKNTDFNSMNHLNFDNKLGPVFHILRNISFSQCLIFSNFQSRARILCEKLIGDGWPTAYISGNQDQKDRIKSMNRLKTANCRILISTDLISRGIDCESVNLVINLDVPIDVETYLHRIGRAGRFGSRAIAITLASDGYESKLLDKLRIEGKLRMFELPTEKNINRIWTLNNPEENRKSLWDSSKYLAELFSKHSLKEDKCQTKSDQRKFRTYYELKNNYEQFINKFQMDSKPLKVKIQSRKRCGISDEEYENLKRILREKTVYDYPNYEDEEVKNNDSHSSIYSGDSSIVINIPSKENMEEMNQKDMEDEYKNIETRRDNLDGKTSSFMNALFPSFETISNAAKQLTWLQSNQEKWSFFLNPDDSYIHTDYCTCSHHHSGFRVTSNVRNKLPNE